MQVTSLILTILFLIETAHCANILFFTLIGSHSMRISQWPLVEALASKGHNVTFLTMLPFEYSKTPKIHVVEAKKWQQTMGSYDQMVNFYEQRKSQPNVFSTWIELHDLGKESCQVSYSDPEFVEWVKTSKFDLVILDTVGYECIFGMLHLWKAKVIMYATSTVMPFYPDAFGMPDETSTVPEMQLGVTPGTEMTFYQRFVNAFVPIVVNLVREYSILPACEEITRKALGKELTKDLPSFVEMDKQINLVFLTSHFSLDNPLSLPPNVIPIGGNVIAKKQQPLSKEIEQFINSSPNGFIYISFGTVIQFTQFPESVQLEFIKALGHLKNMRFIWAAPKEINVMEIPKNVLITKWAPQQTIFAHPKLHAFVTHSGMGSTFEAIHFAVPMVCIPLFADQDFLADATVRRGVGVKVEILDLKKEALIDAIKEVVQNKKYKEKMNKLSVIFKDRPMPPLETAVWWTEYILRHDNTNEYLLSPSARLPFWKRRQIDVWLAAALILITVVTVPISFLYLIIKKLVCARSNQTRHHKLKTN